ncbi:hypothetical protein V6N13_039899 [Hibiscus sabdariffa]|uniref:Uncharacterized protein n=1 Tax=Hibiscus sabdariffa TaxID=183260 RepID=A0ABR2SU25_9ROSI
MPTGDSMVLAEEPTVSYPHESNQAVNDQIVEPIQAEPHISPPTDSVAPEEVDAVVVAERNTPSLVVVNDEPAISYVVIITCNHVNQLPILILCKRVAKLAYANPKSIVHNLNLFLLL